jgi:predicted ATP-dependent serine protease
MAKLLSASQVLSIKRKTIQLDGAWGECLGEIDRTGVVLVWGQSGNGKSSAVMSLAKELTKHGKVLYVSLEEGYALSFQNTIRRYSMQECGSRFQVVTGEDIETISKRLEKRRAADFVVIDSFQYSQLLSLIQI